MKIAVYTDSGGGLVPFREAEIITVYDNTAGWTTVGEIKLGTVKGGPVIMTEIRRNAELAANLLGGCEVIAGAQMTGIPYHVFDSRGLKIFEITELDEGVLDAIAEEVSEAVEVKPCGFDETVSGGCEAPTEKCPKETSTPGVYFFDLAKAQKSDPSLTSKKALLGFFGGTAYDMLILVCAHIPPWIERGDYNIETLQNGDGTVTAHITPRHTAGS